jgi:hypothetical protein
MPRSHKPSKVSAIINQGNGDKFVDPLVDNGSHVCGTSPTGAHWWKIGHPVDGKCYGTCYFCHETRRFRASLDDAYNGRTGND